MLEVLTTILWGHCSENKTFIWTERLWNNHQFRSMSVSSYIEATAVDNLSETRKQYEQLSASTLVDLDANQRQVCDVGWILGTTYKSKPTT
jgi:hypothetical protein